MAGRWWESGRVAVGVAYGRGLEADWLDRGLGVWGGSVGNG